MLYDNHNETRLTNIYDEPRLNVKKVVQTTFLFTKTEMCSVYFAKKSSWCGVNKFSKKCKSKFTFMFLFYCLILSHLI